MASNNLKLDSSLSNLLVATHEINKTLTWINYLKYDISQGWKGEEAKGVQAALQIIKDDLTELTSSIDSLKLDLQRIGAASKEQ